MAKKIPKPEKVLHESGKKVEYETVEGRKYFKSAVMVDSKAISYFCPNNKALTDDLERSHYFAHHCSEKYEKKKIPKCPYCKSLTTLKDYDVKEESDGQ